MKNKSETTQRKLHYDLLRILAAFSVVMLHASAQFWYDLDLRSGQWIIANAYDGVFRFGVPIFVMISGAMFLDKGYKLDTKRLYRHNILRMVVLYVVWSCIYGLYDCRTFDLAEAGIKPVLREIINGRYHLWFLPMIAGIYVILPILKSWLEHTEKKQVEYFLWLFFGLQIVKETLRALTVSDELHTILDLGNVELVCGYVGYFVWGYYLAHFSVGEKLRRAVYLLFVPATVANVVLGTVLSWRAGQPQGTFFDSFGLFTFVMVTALFLFTVEKGTKHVFGEKSSKIVRELSADTLGVYLMHIGCMEILESLGVHSMMVPNIVGIPLFALLCYVICSLLAAALRRVPVVGKYLC